MTIKESLQAFYEKNNLDINGGEDNDFFELKFRLFSLKLPNSKFRKEVVYIHDIQHILYNCDTSWKGESFIAGWEIGSGLWKYFPISIMSLWAMGFSIFNYPKEVYKGYKAGINTKGVIDLDISKEEILALTIPEVKKLIQKEKKVKLNWVSFLFWILLSELVFLFPILVLGSVIFYFKNS